MIGRAVKDKGGKSYVADVGSCERSGARVAILDEPAVKPAGPVGVFEIEDYSFDIEQVLQLAGSGDSKFPDVNSDRYVKNTVSDLIFSCD